MNAYEIMAGFKKAAKKARWSEEKIDKVLADAKSGDYDHLNEVIISAMADIES